jgi:GT2 family glycosyltransferase
VPEPAGEPLVSILLPSWNTRDGTLAFLASLLAQGFPLETVELIIIDNGSRDGSASALERWRAAHVTRFRRVLIEALPENRGIAAAYNRGFELTDPSADVVVRAESDVIWDSPVLDRLVATLRADPTIGVAGARGVLLRDPARVEHAARLVNWWTGVVRSLDPPGLRDCDAVLGSTFAFRRAAVEGGKSLFPRDRFFADELGFCTRVKRSGYRVVCQPAARVHHRSAASTGQLAASRFLFADVFERVLLQRELNALVRRTSVLGAMAARAAYRRDPVTLSALAAAFAYAWWGRRPVEGEGDLGHRFADWLTAPTGPSGR